MSLADFFGEGNPDGIEDEMQLEGVPISLQQGQKTDPNSTEKEEKGSSTSPKKSTYLIISIVLLAAVASLGFGLIEGLSERSAGSGGLIISSIPLTSPSAAELQNGSVGGPTSFGGATAAGQNNAIPSGGEVVGNKSNHEYELPWCQPQVSNIGSANQKWFANANAAKSAGFSADPTCAGNE